MSNDYFSKKDEMRPFVVKKMNTPPSSMLENKKPESEPTYHVKDERESHTSHRITDEHVYEVSGRNNKRPFHSIKPFVLSSISAILIGVLLGFIVLRMSTSATEPAVDQGSTAPQMEVAANEPNESEDETAQTHGDLIDLPAIEAYVLQAGVYAEKENAEEMATKLENSGHSPVVWEEDQQFFVFSNVFSTEEHAKNSVATMEDENIEVYAKLWRVEQQSAEITEDEATFLEEFVTIWTETVEKQTIGEFDSLAVWVELTTEMPSGDATQALVAYLEESIVEAESAIDIEQVLLETWKLYKLPVN